MRITNISVEKKDLKKVEYNYRRNLKNQFKKVQESIEKDAAEIVNKELYFFKQITHTQVVKYIDKYDKAWNLLTEKVYNIPESIENVKKSVQGSQEEQERQIKNAYSDWVKKVDVSGDEIEIVSKFILTLYEGEYLLADIRERLTKQKIETNFYMLQDDGHSMKRIAKNKASYKVVLSTYGASGNNYLSLAYKMEGPMRQENNSRAEALTEQIKNRAFFNHLSNVKRSYVDDYLNNPRENEDFKGENYYKVRWDSKDAEIIELFLQTREDQYADRAIALEKYKKDRLRFGGGGGHKTTMLQKGDIENIQVKLFGKNNNTVNFARQTLVYKTCTELKNILGENNDKALLEYLKKTFTENKETDNISETFTNEAIKNIEQLFKVLIT